MPTSVFLTQGSGDVTGPLSSTNSGFAQYDGTTGDLLKDHPASVAIDTEVSGLGTGVASLLSGTPSGTGVMVGTTTPTLVTPVLGVATGTSVNLSGNCRAASFNVGATAGADGTGTVITAITVTKGIVTSITVS